MTQLMILNQRKISYLFALSFLFSFIYTGPLSAVISLGDSAISAHSVNGTEMTPFANSKELEPFQCPIFSDSPYVDMLKALDSMQTELNKVFPACKDNPYQVDLQNSSVNLKNKISEIKEASLKNETFKMNQLSVDLGALTQKLNSILSQQSQANFKGCYTPEVNRNLIFSMSETYQTMTPMVLDILSHFPSTAVNLSPVAQVLIGTDGLTKGLLFIEQIAKNSVFFNMTNPKNRLNLIKNVCQFMRLYNQLEFLRNQRSDQINSSFENYESQISELKSRLNTLKKADQNRKKKFITYAQSNNIETFDVDSNSQVSEVITESLSTVEAQALQRFNQGQNAQREQFNSELKKYDQVRISLLQLVDANKLLIEKSEKMTQIILQTETSITSLSDISGQQAVVCPIYSTIINDITLQQLMSSVTEFDSKLNQMSQQMIILQNDSKILLSLQNNEILKQIKNLIGQIKNFDIASQAAKVKLGESLQQTYSSTCMANGSDLISIYKKMNLNLSQINLATISFFNTVEKSTASEIETLKSKYNLEPKNKVTQTQDEVVIQNRLEAHRFEIEQQSLNKKIKALEKESELLEPFKNFATQILASEVEKQSARLHRYFFKGPDFVQSCSGNSDQGLLCGLTDFAVKFRNRGGPVLELLKNTEQSFKDEYSSMMRALMNLRNFEDQFVIKETAKSKNNLEYYKNLKSTREKYFSEFPHLNLNVIVKNSALHQSLCSDIKLAIQKFRIASTHALANLGMCDMIKPVLKENDGSVSLEIRNYCISPRPSLYLKPGELGPRSGLDKIFNQMTGDIESNVSFSAFKIIEKLLIKDYALDCEKTTGSAFQKAYTQ